MSIEQIAGPWEPWFPREQPADLRELDDLIEDAEFEAAVCGDVGFVDRVFTARDFEGFEDVEDVERVWVPADPAEVLGRAGWLAACGGELNRVHARFLAAAHQAGHTRLVEGQGRPGRDPSACAEVGAALGWSAAMAGSWLTLAYGVVERLPALHAAMAAGELDLVKARVFVDDTADMPTDLARLVVARLLARAAGLTKKQLAEQVEIVSAQLDPDWHRRREQAALSRARVEYTRTRSGTGEVAVRDVPAAGAAVIKARVEAISQVLRRAARQADIALGLPALRALVSQRLLDGTYGGLDDDALVERLVDELPEWHHELFGPDDPGDDPGLDDSSPDDPHSPDGSTGSGPTPEPGPDTDPDGSRADGPSPDGPGPDGDNDLGSGPSDAGRGAAGIAPESTASESTAPESTAPESTAPDTSRADPRPAVRAGTTELRMRLSTALGLDDLPAQLPGSGALSAHSARRRLAAIRAGDTPTEWRVVLVDPDGRLEHVLLARPDPPPRPPRRHHRQRRVQGLIIVELAAATTMLADLDPADHPAWAELIRRARTQLAGLATRGAQVGGPHHPATSITDARRRFPGAALDRYVRVRDRYCIGVLCTGVAHDADIDHTRDWARHGLTVAANLGPPCRRCHRLKHRDGWQLTQPTPGTFVWRTPLGATYTVAARPVLEPAPDPTPTVDGRPRPVLDTHHTRHPDDHGWLDPPLRLLTRDRVPTPPDRRADGDHRDGLPF